MSLIEALVAITVLAGICGTAVETFRTAVVRAEISGMVSKVASVAENLLARTGEDLPLQAGETIATDGGVLTWTTKGGVIATAGEVQMLEVRSHVKYARSGTIVEQKLATIKLIQAKHR